ncbi:MAG: AbrB/MazE/SpoVT family DNA-binding domain-containing protein [Desulfurococcales archaeon]|nr:AbrB/MazE/SpoVT family DNA-binding domain-containing protein [Desulfurococcales archaeon]
MIAHPRRVQKLGTSSLVLALPKEWVKKQGIDKGDVLYVVEEGESLRIIKPIEEKVSEPPALEAYKLKDSTLVSIAANCLYILGYNDYMIDLKNLPAEVQLLLKRHASRLIGIEFSYVDKDKIRVKNIMNMETINPYTSIKSMGISVSQIFEILSKATKGEWDILSLTDELREEIFRLQHLIVKYLSSRMLPGTDDSRTYSLLLGTSLLGIISEDSYNVTKVLMMRKETPGRDVLAIIDRLTAIMPQVSSNLTNPSISRSKELIKETSNIRQKLNKVVLETNTVIDAILAQFLLTVVSILWIVSTISVCNSLACEDIWRKKEG